MTKLEDRAFVWLLVAVSIAFAWIVWPFFAAVLWATVFAVVFIPLQRWLLRRLGPRPNAAALLSLLIILVIVVLPLLGVGAALIDETAAVYRRLEAGEFNVRAYVQQAWDAAPAWARSALERFGLTDLAAVQARLSTFLTQASKLIATQAVNVGQNIFEFVVGLFVMLYLLYFLLRDGERLVKSIRRSMPLASKREEALFEKFTVVVRATVKGNVVIALIQGALGGLIFWVLGIDAALFWGVVMALFSLLPAVGTALVWIPAALYFFATGAAWKGVVLVAFGIFVIGLVDNFLRPMLVGRDTKMPDYVVLISTLGGIALLGMNGFVVGPIIAALFIAAWDLAAESSS
ncbi:MAG: AI-2E family transporter [Burkholderiales bacterium]